MVKCFSKILSLVLAVFFLSSFQSSIALASQSGLAGQPPKSMTRSKNEFKTQLAYQRAFEAVVWSMPALNIYRLRKGFLSIPGVADNVVVAYSGPAVSKHKAITANAVTPYIAAYTDLRKGPVVLELPAKSGKASLYGQIVDAWQSTIADVGPSGLDRGKGGKYLLIPPGYKEKLPQGYLHVRSASYRIGLVFRSIRGEGATNKDAYDYTQKLKMYYLSEGKRPRPTRFVDGLPHPLQTLPYYDIRALQDIHDIISVEPVREQDKVMMGMLATIGIEPGKPFKPSKKMKKAMAQGVADAYDYIQEMVENHHENNRYWPDRHWSFVMTADDKGGFDFVSDTAVEIDKRATAWSFFTFYPKKLADQPATVYLSPTRDSDGRKLEAGFTYRVRVPKDMPTKQFWSITVYDNATWAFLDNPLQRSGLGSFNKEKMIVNNDGSTDVYFGPAAPEGMERNWIPAMDKKPYVWLRLYGPDEPFWNKSFVMPDVERLD